MSQENVEIVRRIYASLTRGDDEWRDLAPDCVFDFSRRKFDAFVAHGPDDPILAGVLADVAQHWEGGTFWDPQELIDAGDKVFATVRTGGRGKGSGIEVDTLVLNVWTFREGAPVEAVYFGDDRAEAIEAAGLSE